MKSACSKKTGPNRSEGYRQSQKTRLGVVKEGSFW